MYALDVEGWKGAREVDAPTYVIDTQGTIRYAFLDADYKKRAEPSEVVDEVLKLTGSTAADAPPVVGE